MEEFDQESRRGKKAAFCKNFVVEVIVHPDLRFARYL